ncbi:uncharacterized protein UV8b_03267 [Ustilaginoidea virens]|uniref:BZIP domain-containing protein n=1 Tax=Ustilaginoidea virens TaxID=1159556 RepID=A0A8E5MGW3_USTVR|nr:uncharacterized protein UV8b_03267 [Ustilaginoidea virens]QUC19026.1 hypothetical protein UV8b_03267 [Ustilaginoidea virens]
MSIGSETANLSHEGTVYLGQDDDWTQATDPRAKKRIQNRNAQRSYRQRMKMRMAELARLKELRRQSLERSVLQQQIDPRIVPSVEGYQYFESARTEHGVKDEGDHATMRQEDGQDHNYAVYNRNPLLLDLSLGQSKSMAQDGHLSQICGQPSPGGDVFVPADGSQLHSARQSASPSAYHHDTFQQSHSPPVLEQGQSNDMEHCYPQMQTGVDVGSDNVKAAHGGPNDCEGYVPHCKGYQTFSLPMRPSQNLANGVLHYDDPHAGPDLDRATAAAQPFHSAPTPLPTPLPTPIGSGLSSFPDLHDGQDPGVAPVPSNAAHANHTGSPPPCLGGPSSFDDKFRRIMTEVEAAGFNSFDDLVSAYYIRPFEDVSHLATQQRISRNRGLPRILGDIFAATSQWTTWEKHGIQQEILKISEELLEQEQAKSRDVVRAKFNVLMEQIGSGAGAHSVELKRAFIDMGKLLQEQQPNSWALLITLAGRGQTACPRDHFCIVLMNMMMLNCVGYAGNQMLSNMFFALSQMDLQ